MEEFSKIQDKAGNLAELSNKLEIENINIGASVEKFFSLTNLITQQTKLLANYNREGKVVSPNSLFLIAEFPEKYLAKLEQSIYPAWYSASFLLDCSNSAIWGHYGDNHKTLVVRVSEHRNHRSSGLRLGG